METFVRKWANEVCSMTSLAEGQGQFDKLLHQICREGWRYVGPSRQGDEV